jgi:lipopolysaccharide transport system ATP-binding protein
LSSVIKVENISKQYRLGEVGTGSLSHDINKWWHNVRGKENPYLQIGDTNDRATKGDSDYVWALKDINFEVQQGEVLGIIGRNGAGKSTLLKILSKTTTPTTGSIKIKGRIASLLEVGTGFHPELTGRDNIFLNGAILGMTKKEIKSKFDEIVDFAGVERYIDTPVKRYSSGMYVRLAFGVAAHLEPEILIVDEVLAVGDAEFQKKALGKMKEVSEKGGRTVLFVSHNLAAVKQLCTKGIVMQNGNVVFNGTSHKSIEYYQKINEDNIDTIKEKKLIIENIKSKHFNIQIHSITINDSDLATININGNSTILEIKIKGTLSTKFSFSFGLGISDMSDNLLAIYSPGHLNGEIIKCDEGDFEMVQRITIPTINKGEYKMSLSLQHPNVEVFLLVENLKLISSGIISPTGLEFDYERCGFIFLK